MWEKRHKKKKTNDTFCQIVFNYPYMFFALAVSLLSNAYIEQCGTRPESVLTTLCTGCVTGLFI